MRSNNTEGNGNRPKRKPPAKVVSLHTGDPLEPDEITDADYEKAIAVQDARLFAEGNERRVLGQLRVRLERGAIDNGKRYYFDLARGIVRRREREEAG